MVDNWQEQFGGRSKAEWDREQPCQRGTEILEFVHDREDFVAVTHTEILSLFPNLVLFLHGDFKAFHQLNR